MDRALDIAAAHRARAAAEYNHWLEYVHKSRSTRTVRSALKRVTELRHELVLGAPQSMGVGHA